MLLFLSFGLVRLRLLLATLPSRVMAFERIFKVGERNMGVDLGRPNILMPQEKLDRPDVESFFKKMGCKGVAKHVGRERGGDSCGSAVLFDEGPEGLAGQGCAVSGKKELRAVFGKGRADHGEVILKEVAGPVVEKGDTFLGALSHDPQGSCRHVDPVGCDVSELRDPETGGIKEGEDRPIAEPFRTLGIRGVDQPPDILLRENPGKCTGKAGSDRGLLGILSYSGGFEKVRPGPDRGEKSGPGTHGKILSNLHI